MPRPRLPHDTLSPTTLYRYGARDEVATTAHSQQSAAYRRRVVLAAWRPIEGRLIGLIASGMPLREAADECGLSLVAVHGRSRWDPAWRVRLDAALVAGRDPSLPHGTEQSYRHGRCRCPECRDAHDATRGDRRP